MRVIRKKLKKNVSDFLGQLSNNYGFDDADIVRDFFALLRNKGGGIPAKERVDRMVTAIVNKFPRMSPIGVRLLINKRKEVYTALTKLPYFMALAEHSDPIKATERLIQNMQKMYKKKRESACLACALKPNCEFGKQYSNVADISIVVDPDYQRKVNQDCPTLPDMNALANMLTGIKTLMQLTEAQDENDIANQNQQAAEVPEELAEAMEKLAAGSGPKMDEDEETVDPDEMAESEFFDNSIMKKEDTQEGIYSGRHDADHFVEVSEKLIDDCTRTNLVIFEIGDQFSKLFAQHKKQNMKATEKVERDSVQENIVRESDVTKLASSQHGLPEEVFEAKLNKRALTKQQFVEPNKAKKKLLYLLVDNSGSMQQQLAPGGTTNPFALYSRGAMSLLLSTALLDKTRKEKGKLFVRFFTEGIGPLKTAETDEEFELLRHYVANASYKQGGTNIPAVITTAVRDIKESNTALSDAEILLMTDCEDIFHAQDVLTILNNKIELNVLDVSGGGSYSHASKALKDCAKRYYKADEREADLAKIVKLL